MTARGVAARSGERCGRRGAGRSASAGAAGLKARKKEEVEVGKGSSTGVEEEERMKRGDEEEWGTRVAGLKFTAPRYKWG